MNCRLLLFLLLLFPLTDTLGQSIALAELINCIDLQNGADNLLVNGRPYIPSNPQAEGHPYFQAADWKPGKVYINGHSFSAEQLKYDIFNFQLIIQQEQAIGTTQKVVLSDLLVDSFQIDGYLFINRGLILPAKENSAYLEKIFAQKLSFFRFQKKVLDPLTNLRPYGNYSHLKDVFFLLRDDKYHKFSQKKGFLACFPDHKTAIKKYFKNHSLKWKKMTKSQFIQLLKFCDDQI